MATTAPRPENRVMACGCADIGSVAEGGKWVRGCPMHGVTEPMDPQPDLARREARCYCGMLTPSKPSLAFFRMQPERKYDEYYCGCKGWD